VSGGPLVAYLSRYLVEWNSVYLQTYLVVIRSRSGDGSGLVFVAVRLSCLSIIRYST